MQTHRIGRWLMASTLLLFGGLSSCSNDEADSDASTDDVSTDEDGISLDNDGGGGVDGNGTDGNAGPWSLPADFVSGTFGGYKLGPTIQGEVDPSDLVPPGDEGCGSTIVGVIRDMAVSHPDFEDLCCGSQQGIVEALLGDDQKPVYAHPGPTALTTGPEAFNQWYRTEPAVNEPFLIYLNLQPNGGVFTFHSESFFPLDGQGFGDQGNNHNFHFTTEIHTKFAYGGGETFRFVGDDDVWVFINGHLAIDLGGVHGAEMADVAVDDVASEFGLIIGAVYPLDLFQAERHTSESNFRIDTTLSLVDCGYVVVDVPVK